MLAPEAYAKYHEHMGDQEIDSATGHVSNVIKREIDKEEDFQSLRQNFDSDPEAKKLGIDSSIFGKVGRAGGRGAIKEIMKDPELFKLGMKAVEKEDFDNDKWRDKVPSEYHQDVEGSISGFKKGAEHYGKYHAARESNWNVMKHIRKMGEQNKK